MPKAIRKPSYLLHKASGRGKVRVNGRDIYFSGIYGSPESRAEYDDFIREWFAQQDMTRCRLTVDDLVLLYLEHAAEYYRKNGEMTREVSAIRVALRHLVAVHGRTRIRNFGPAALKQVRAAMIEAGHVRTSINAQVRRIRRMFKWAVENEYIPVEAWQALSAVSGLRSGRSPAREPEPILPVDNGTMEATLPHLPRVVADMVRLQLLTGARPGEICSMRPCDVTRGIDGVWTYRPDSHKTEHHGRERRIFVGPEGQKILAPYLDRDPDAYCFSPAESEAERNAGRKRNRKSPMTPSQAARKPKGADAAPPVHQRQLPSGRGAGLRSRVRHAEGIAQCSLDRRQAPRNRTRRSEGQTLPRGRSMASEALLESKPVATQPGDDHPRAVRHRGRPGGPRALRSENNPALRRARLRDSGANHARDRIECSTPDPEESDCG